MFLAGIEGYRQEIATVCNTNDSGIWVAVLVERGCVSEVRAFGDERSAFRQEALWRFQMNPDYDETGVSQVHVEYSDMPRNT